MNTIRLLAIDPALRNFGLAMLVVDTKSLAASVERMTLIETTNLAGKTVRQNSDDLRRAFESYQAAKEWVEDCDLIAAEIPSGSQSARGTMSNGISIGILAGLRDLRPLIEVMPRDVKKTVTGRTTASKDEMIAWAVKAFPQAPWLRHKRNGIMELTAKNEHMADACAIGLTAIRDPQFKAAVAIQNSVARTKPPQILCAV